MTDHLHNQDVDNDDSQIVLATDAYVQDASGLLWMHAIFFWLGLVVIGLTFLMQSSGQTSVFLPGASVALPEVCTAKRVFGVPCPGCGLTRSFISISHGQFGRAWGFNPASFLLYPFVFVQIPWHAMQYWLTRKRGYGVHVPYLQFLPIAIGIILLLQWLIRLPHLS